jgi:hypothetical protein
MLKNYFRVALRNLVRNRFTTAINVGGLAIGMAVAILIGLWLYDEITFNDGARDHDRIAQVMQNQDLSGGRQTWSGQAMQLAPALRKDYPALFKYIVTAAGDRKQLIVQGDKKIRIIGNYMDPEVIGMLSLKMIKGNNTALRDPSGVILSETAAKDLFDGADPMGKTILLDGKNPVTVTGVYADFPRNSYFARTRYIC